MIGKAVLTLGANTKGFTSSLGKAQGALTSFSNVIPGLSMVLGPLTKAFKTLTLAVGAFYGALFAGGAIAAKFETQMAEIKTMLFQNEEAFAGLEKGVKELSLTYGESTKTLSRGLYDILSAGIPAADALEVLDVSARSAVAGLTTTGVTADAITSVINAFGLEAKNAAAIAETLARTVIKGKTTWGELAPQIGKTVSNAALAGITFEEVAASISMLTQRGVKTPEAVTAINRALIAIMATGPRQIELFRSMGIEADGFGAKIKDLGDFFRLLSHSIGTASEATNEKLKELFQIRGIKYLAAGMESMESATNSFTDHLDFVRGKVGGDMSALEFQFKKMADTTAFEMGRLKQAFNIMVVEIFTPLLPHIRRLLGFIRSIFDEIRKNSPDATNFFKKAMDYLIDIIALAIKFGVNIGEIVFNIGSLLYTLYLKAKAIIGEDGIKGLLTWLMKWWLNWYINNLRIMIAVTLKMVKGLFKDILESATSVFAPVTTKIVSNLRKKFGILDGIDLEFKDYLGADEKYKDVFKDFEDAHKDRMKAADEFTDKIKSKVDELRQKWKDFDAERAAAEKAEADAARNKFRAIDYLGKMQEKRNRKAFKVTRRNWEQELADIDSATNKEKERLKLKLQLLKEWEKEIRAVGVLTEKEDKLLVKITKRYNKAMDQLRAIVLKEEKARRLKAKQEAKERWRKYKEETDAYYQAKIEEVDLLRITEEEKLDLQISFLNEWLNKYEQGTREWIKVYKKLTDTVAKLDEKAKKNVDELLKTTQTALQAARMEYVEWAEKTLRMGERGMKGHMKIAERYRLALNQVFKEEMRKAAELSKGGWWGDRWENAMQGLAKLKRAAETMEYTEKQRAQAAQLAQKAQDFIERKAKAAFGEEWRQELKKRGIKYGLYKEQISAEEQALKSQKEFRKEAEATWKNISDKTEEVKNNLVTGLSDGAKQVHKLVMQLLDEISKKVDEIVNKLKGLINMLQSGKNLVGGAGGGIINAPGGPALVGDSASPMSAGMFMANPLSDAIAMLGRSQDILADCCPIEGRCGDKIFNIGPVNIARMGDAVDAQIAGEEMAESLLEELGTQTPL